MRLTLPPHMPRQGLSAQQPPRVHPNLRHEVGAGWQGGWRRVGKAAGPPWSCAACCTAAHPMCTHSPLHISSWQSHLEGPAFTCSAPDQPICSSSSRRRRCSSSGSGSSRLCLCSAPAQERPGSSPATCPHQSAPGPAGVGWWGWGWMWGVGGAARGEAARHEQKQQGVGGCSSAMSGPTTRSDMPGSMSPSRMGLLQACRRGHMRDRAADAPALKVLRRRRALTLYSASRCAGPHFSSSRSRMMMCLGLKKS